MWVWRNPQKVAKQVKIQNFLYENIIIVEKFWVNFDKFCDSCKHCGHFDLLKLVDNRLEISSILYKNKHGVL